MKKQETELLDDQNKQQFIAVRANRIKHTKDQTDPLKKLLSSFN
jgi:hypothetical protein